MSESQLMSSIVDRILLTHRGRVMVLRINQGTLRGYRGHAAKWSVDPGVWETDGCADLLLGVCIGAVARADGGIFNVNMPRLCGLEIKDPDGHTKPARRLAQARFRDEINSMGGYAVAVDNIAQAMDHIHRAMLGEAAP